MSDSKTRDETRKGSAKAQTTFGLIKPEAFEMGLVQEIERRIENAGLKIVDKKVLVMDDPQFEAVYGKVKNDRPRMYELLKNYLRDPNHKVEVLEVEGEDAVRKLLELRGASNPKDALPGTIRGDFAKDQVYLPDHSTLSKNVFHAADSIEEAEQMASAFSENVTKTDYFFSESLGLYVSRKPLKMDSRVKDAAERAEIKVDWNDEGMINNMTYNDSNRLFVALGSGMLSPDEYWKVLGDAISKKDPEMLEELTSDRYTEWLSRVYFKDPRSSGSILYINHPKVAGRYEFEGEIRVATCPIGRPGWFNPEGNINAETGEPIHVDQRRPKDERDPWKYWSPELGLNSAERIATAPIRGYVTSVGKPSLDLGIPVDSRQPNCMMRECRKALLEPEIDSRILSRAEKLVKSGNEGALAGFVSVNGGFFSTSQESHSYRLREIFFDVLGYASLHADVKLATDRLCGIKEKSLTYDSFRDFIQSSKSRLGLALEQGKDVVFVMGHKNPDTDTVISSVFEAWRNHLMNGDKTVYIPIVQSSRMPGEISALLGGLSQHVMFSSDPLYKTAKSSGLARWISVDQNTEPEVQKYFISIIDHHSVSDFAKQRDVPRTLEKTGSCCALIALKYLGMGLNFDSEIARLMYGATLMDTENRVSHKMTKKDAELMDYLKSVSGIRSDDELYPKLMSKLLETDDADLLFNRDYKEDWGFGFAVAKTKGCFSGDGALLKGGLVSRLRALAEKNNKDKNLPLTLLRITDYGDDNETVNHERIYMVFNERASANFKKAVSETLEAVIRFELPEDSVSTEKDSIDFWGSGRQLSRKSTAPVLEPVVAAFNRYFYSPSTNLWVKRDFLKYTSEVKRVADNLSTDKQNRINNITLEGMKELETKLNFGTLSIGEYFKVYDDARKVNDAQMLESLQNPKFGERWDTVILNKRIVIDHVVMKDGKMLSNGKELNVPEGSPGLIRPDEVDRETGIPTSVMSPSHYGMPSLWRYWAPDSDVVSPVRSYIFLLNQPSWDGKVYPDDAFPNLGIRPVAKEVKDPEVESHQEGSAFILSISIEGDRQTYTWQKSTSA